MGSLAAPESGFVPALAGVALAVLGGFVLYGEGRAMAARGAAPPVAPAPDAARRWRVIAAVVALLAYALLLEPLGLVLTTLLVLGVLFRFVGGVGWTASLAATVAGTVFSYVLFARWLKVPFPPGPWGF